MTPAQLDQKNSIDQSMGELRRFPRAQWLDLVRGDQSHRWRKGLRVPAEEYFLQLPELRREVEEALVLISGEVALRQEIGESPTIEEYQCRFPEFADAITLQFSVHRILGSAEGNAGAGEGEREADDFPVDLSDLELPGYVFLGEIARGGSGVVYKARQESLGRFVAIKMIPLVGADAKRLVRHRQEAEILAQLNHPNVVHIHEVREHRGCLHLVMEYVCGTTLAEHNAGRPCTADEAARLSLTLAEAVHAVHVAGVLHRDLKPSNVLVTERGELKISDFGLAKLQAGGGSRLTVEESVLGTPSYMSPEQAGGESNAIGAEADVYSLGAILYELLTGRPPFLGVTVLDTLSLIRTRDPVAPRQLQPRTPRDLETICLKCLAKSPRQRYATAAVLADDLRRYRAGMPILARPPRAVERFVRQVRRKPAVSALVASLAVLAFVVAGALWTSANQHRRLSAAALVESIATADSQALPQLLGKISAQQDTVLPLIRTGLAASSAGEPRWVNLSVAELTADPTATGDALLDYLSSARLAEVPAIVNVLAARSESIAQPLWRELLDDHTTDDARLRLACLAARVSPDHPKWTAVAPTVTRALLQQHPLDMGTLSNALQPARGALIAPLVAATRDPRLQPLSRNAAVSIMARYAADRPAVLVDLIVEAEPDEFRLLLPSLRPHVGEVLPKLSVLAAESVTIAGLSRRGDLKTKHDVESAYDARQRRRANALVLAWLLGDADPALAALRRTPEPALRSWLIERLGPLGVSRDALWRHAIATTDAGVRQALLLAVGESPPQTGKLDERDNFVAGVEELYRTDADAGVHAACQWLLKTRLDRAAVVEQFLASPNPITPRRQWYVGLKSHSFTVLPGPATFTKGSPATELTREPDEVLREARVERGFAIGTEEVTVAQFRRFNHDHHVYWRFSPTNDCPMNVVTWFDAAAYCRWLSEQAGLSEDQMCYPPIPEIRPGMRLPANVLERTGYRLPTETEWEYACRGGVTASRPCGEGGQLLVRYAWFLNNSDDHAHPVGTLKPNDFGLFDMLGNVIERCHDVMGPGPATASTTTSSGGEIVRSNDIRHIRGADFGASPHNLRSARRHANPPGQAWASLGFRVARTLPK